MRQRGRLEQSQRPRTRHHGYIAQGFVLTLLLPAVNSVGAHDGAAFLFRRLGNDSKEDFNNLNGLISSHSETALKSQFFKTHISVVFMQFPENQKNKIK